MYMDCIILHKCNMNANSGSLYDWPINRREQTAHSLVEMNIMYLTKLPLDLHEYVIKICTLYIFYLLNSHCEKNLRKHKIPLP